MGCVHSSLGVELFCGRRMRIAAQRPWRAVMTIGHDMTRAVDLTRKKSTGPVRSKRPIYVDLLPPCNVACPAGENIQAWLSLAQAAKFREAWEALVRDNPLPAVHGRVCYHPCETSCNRKDLDSSVSI